MAAIALDRSAPGSWMTDVNPWRNSVPSGKSGRDLAKALWVVANDAKHLEVYAFVPEPDFDIVDFARPSLSLLGYRRARIIAGQPMKPRKLGADEY